MAASRKLDLWELFQRGRAGEIIFGKTECDFFTERDPEFSAIEDDSRYPRVPGMAETKDVKVYFNHEAVPTLYSIRIRITYESGKWGISDAVSDTQMFIPKIGPMKLSFGKYTWESLRTLSSAILTFGTEKYFCRSNLEKIILLVWVKGSRRLTLEYALSPHVLEGNAYEIDYFLQNIGVEDMVSFKLSNQKLKKYFLKG